MVETGGPVVEDVLDVEVTVPAVELFVLVLVVVTDTLCELIVLDDVVLLVELLEVVVILDVVEILDEVATDEELEPLEVLEVVERLLLELTLDVTL